MSDETETTSVPEAAAPVAPPAPEPRRRGGRGFALFLIVLLGLAGAFAAYLWQQLEKSSALLEKQVSQTESQIQDVRQHMQGLQERIRDQVLSQMDRLQSQQKSLEQSIAALYAQRRRQADEQEWNLSEIMYLLNVAHQRLLLAQDVDAALTALQAADKRLSQHTDPQYLPIRERLAGDMARLRAIKQPDIAGMALQLGDHIKNVDGMPLQQGYQDSVALAEAQESKNTGSGGTDTSWQALPGKVWGELKQLVTIRHNSSGDGALLAPEQRYFLHENLRLQLEHARFFLLRRDTAQFRGALQTVQIWLQKYYDNTSPRVSLLLDNVKTMLVVELQVPLPDISESLRALQDLALEAEPDLPAATVNDAPEAEAAPQDKKSKEDDGEPAAHTEKPAVKPGSRGVKS